MHVRTFMNGIQSIALLFSVSWAFDEVT